MANIYLLLSVFLVLWYFAFLRKISEAADKQVRAYCQKEGLQFITLARRTTRLSFNKKTGLHWLSIFDLEFSGDGQSSYQGTVVMQGLKMAQVALPAYRIE